MTGDWSFSLCQPAFFEDQQLISLPNLPSCSCFYRPLYFSVRLNIPDETGWFASLEKQKALPTAYGQRPTAYGICKVLGSRVLTKCERDDRPWTLSSSKVSGLLQNQQGWPRMAKALQNLQTSTCLLWSCSVCQMKLWDSQLQGITRQPIVASDTYILHHMYSRVQYNFQMLSWEALM